MALKNIDLRLIDGEIATISKTIKNYLCSIGFTKDRERITDADADIRGRNLQRSVIKLFLSSSPQIVQWHLVKKSEKQVQIEVKFDLFRKFRIFYYGLLSIFLVCFGGFYKVSNFYTSINSPESLVSGIILMLIGVAFLMLAIFFEFRFINTEQYDRFLSKFYEMLSVKGFTGETVLRSECSFPDFLPGVFVFVLLLLGSVVGKKFPFDWSISVFMILLLLCILIILAVVTFLKPALSYRMLFSIIGIGLCIPLALHGSAPAINLLANNVISKVKESEPLYNQYVELQNESVEEKNTNSNQRQIDLLHLGRLLRMIVAGVIFFWLVVLFLIILLMLNIIYLPIGVTRRLDRFSREHSDSLYYQALQPGKPYQLFSIIIALVWGVVSTANIAGVYFSLSIFEKTAFGTNYLFRSSITSLFFNNTRTIFIFALRPIISIGTIHLLHKVAMLTYSIPLLSVLFLVLKKNWTSFIRGCLLLKTKTNQYNKLEVRLSKKLEKISRFIDMPMPVIRIVDSPDINAEAKYLSFPICKNVLIVTSGALEILDAFDSEFDALLAHEVWHLKRHTFKLKFLCLISDYTLFGNGFLALLQNSFQIENDADNFAKRWLRINKKPISALTSLLERQEEINVLYGSSLECSLSGSSLNFAMLKDDSYRKKILNFYDNSSLDKKMWINLKLLYQMYFGEEILSYFHPSISQRKDWIES